MAIAKRNVDPNLLAQLVAGTTTQVVGGGYSKTTDSNFPIYSIPMDDKGNPLDNIVYFPANCATVEVDGQGVYNPLELYMHSCRKGTKEYPQYRCTASLSGGAYDSLNYDGECPFCSGGRECWDLYNKSYALKAKEMGIDPSNDPQDTLQAVRSTLLSEMAIKNADAYIAVPIVVISNTRMIPASVDAATMKPYFYIMRKSTYEAKILDQITKLPGGYTSPAGMFFQFQFSYDTKGKPANLRDAGKNATYVPLLDVNSVNALEPFRTLAEDASKEFTRIKAAEIYVPAAFLDKEEQTKIVDDLLKTTRSTLAAFEIEGAGKTANPAIASNSIAGTLAAFGATTATAEATPAPAIESQTPNANVQPNQVMGSFGGFGASFNG